MNDNVLLKPLEVQKQSHMQSAVVSTTASAVAPAPVSAFLLPASQYLTASTLGTSSSPAVTAAQSQSAQVPFASSIVSATSPSVPVPSQIASAPSNIVPAPQPVVSASFSNTSVQFQAFNLQFFSRVQLSLVIETSSPTPQLTSSVFAPPTKSESRTYSRPPSVATAYMPDVKSLL